MPAGRPLKFKSVKQLQEAIDAYFDKCDPHYEDVETEDAEGNIVIKRQLTAQLPYTTTGLALALDTSRETLIDYADGKYDDKASDNTVNDKFSYTVKRAKMRVQDYAENYLFTGKNTAGAIFNLKNNHNWKDRTEIDETSDQTVRVITRKHDDDSGEPYARSDEDD